MYIYIYISLMYRASLFFFFAVVLLSGLKNVCLFMAILWLFGVMKFMGSGDG